MAREALLKAQMGIGMGFRMGSRGALRLTWPVKHDNNTCLTRDDTVYGHGSACRRDVQGLHTDSLLGPSNSGGGQNRDF